MRAGPPDRSEQATENNYKRANREHDDRDRNVHVSCPSPDPRSHCIIRLREVAQRGKINVPTTFKISFYAGALLAALSGLWLAQLWPAEKQVRLHSEHFIGQIEKRNWSAAGDFIASDYHDDWGHDRKEILNQLHLMVRFFSSLTISPANPQVSADSAAGWWSAKIRIEGSGTEFVPEIVSRVNSLAEPFVLHWRTESWRPWDWKLVRVSNPSLEISGRDL